MSSTIDPQPIDTAPWDKWIVVIGGSGYTLGGGYYIALAMRTKGRYNGDWQDVTGERITDRFQEPYAWHESPIYTGITDWSDRS